MVSSKNLENRADHEQLEIEAWQIQKFLKENSKFGANNVRIVPQKEVKQTISGEETIEFDLLFAADGSTVKANLTIKPGEKPGFGQSLFYSADFSGLSSIEKTQAIEKFNQLIIENELKFCPGNTAFNLEITGPNAVEAAKQMKDQMQKPVNLSRFQDKGIGVFINGKSIISNKNELTPEEPVRKSGDKRKPGEVPRVPRGAPKLRRGDEE
jgi:hypothetical protein